MVKGTYLGSLLPTEMPYLEIYVSLMGQIATINDKKDVKRIGREAEATAFLADCPFLKDKITRSQQDSIVNTK